MEHFEIDEIEIFVDISLSNFNNAHTQSKLSLGLWQQTLLVLHVRKQPIDVAREQETLFGYRVPFLGRLIQMAKKFNIVFEKVYISTLLKGF